MFFCKKSLHFINSCAIITKLTSREESYPGVAQLVAHLTGGQGVVSSSLATRTSRKALNPNGFKAFCFFQKSDGITKTQKKRTPPTSVRKRSGNGQRFPPVLLIKNFFQRRLAKSNHFGRMVATNNLKLESAVIRTPRSTEMPVHKRRPDTARSLQQSPQSSGQKNS